MMQKTNTEPTKVFEINTTDDALSFKFSSDMSLVDSLVRRFKEFSHDMRLEVSPRFKIVLRELLINAIEHGNKNDPDKLVTGAITRTKDTEFEIQVQDEGDGFDTDKIDRTPPSDPNQIRQRGYPLIAAFVNTILFNEKGNRVVINMENDQQTTFDTFKEDTWLVIRPSGSLTAAVADKFRNLLQEYVEKGISNFRFDLSFVEDIDSMGLCVFVVLPKLLSEKGMTPELEILYPRRDIVTLLHMTRLDSMYRVCKE